MLTKKDIRHPLIFIAWAISAAAMFGSIFFSEILHYEPCELCWYERIAMFPLFIILGIAAVRKDYQISIYSMVLSLIGAGLSLYHYGIQKLPLLLNSPLSCGRIPCTEHYINWFGFITIPLLGFIAFLSIFIISIIIYKKNKEVTWF